MTSTATETTGTELLRRVLLGAITAWIVARPLVLGEDPGMLSFVTDEHGLVLTLLWFLTALGWAGWRAWTGKGRWGVDAIEGCLFLIAGLMFVSAIRGASYKHPAYLIAWEWLALAVAFVLVRRLAVTAADQHRLLAALVASAVSLSAYAVYQYVDIIPRTRDMLNKTLESDQVTEESRRGLEQQRDRLSLGVYGPFAHPNSFAGYLGLLLPAGVGWAWMSWRQRRWSWHTILACSAVLLVIVALALTRSKGAILASVLVLLLAAMLLRLFSMRTWVLSGLATATVLAVLVAVQKDAATGVDKTTGAFARRLDYWSATWKLLNDPRHADFFWLGVGPGNFGRWYPRYMSETADEEISDPHNLALDVWSSCGVFGAAALLLALALVLRQVWPTVREPIVEDDDEEPNDDTASAGNTRWEFYLGGMVGLTLGFILWALAQPNTHPYVLLDEGMVAGLRSLLWFGMFALLENIPWPGRTRLLAVVAGIVALLLNLTVSGGISFPSVALPLWVMIALALNATAAAEDAPTSWLAAAALVPVTAALSLAYLLLCFYPVSSCTKQVRKALTSTEPYEKAIMRARQGNVMQAQPMLTRAHEYLRTHILKPLEQAATDDPSDAHAVIQLSNWNGKLWDLRHEMQSKDDETVRRLALGQAQHATRLDPEGIGGYLALYRLNKLFATRADADTKKRLHDYAAKQMRQVVERLPTHPGFRFRLAEALMDAGHDKEARIEARQALTLDERMTSPARQLTDEQRQQCKKWAGE